MFDPAGPTSLIPVYFTATALLRPAARAHCALDLSRDRERQGYPRQIDEDAGFLTGFAPAVKLKQAASLAG